MLYFQRGGQVAAEAATGHHITVSQPHVWLIFDFNSNPAVMESFYPPSTDSIPPEFTWGNSTLCPRPSFDAKRVYSLMSKHSLGLSTLWVSPLSAPGPPLMPREFILSCPNIAWKGWASSFPGGPPLLSVGQKQVYQYSSLSSFSGWFWVTFWTLLRGLSRIHCFLLYSIDPKSVHLIVCPRFLSLSHCSSPPEFGNYHPCPKKNKTKPVLPCLTICFRDHPN